LLISFFTVANLPKRDYQFSIVQQALFKNTLVSLPTGLGKTFIAAVVMYNFYRWFPTGKVRLITF
jgi:Fanconi anemia group M protein